jgi:hypothetical protein
MRFKDYKEQLKADLNTPASLQRLAEPFGVQWREFEDPHLLIGHVLDAMSDEFQDHELVDALDIATLAWEMGCHDAGRFLDEAPNMLYRNFKPYGSSASFN